MDFLQSHYIIVVVIIVIIIILQFSVFRRALNKIAVFKEVFPKKKEAYSIYKARIEVLDHQNEETEENETIWREDNDYMPSNITVDVSQINITHKNPTLSNIKEALNMYLVKNKGAVSDFSLMKDIVERYCGSEDDEITVMQPIPLYMGLMGTMIGIIVGIGVIAINGGVEKLTNVSSMMTCVAIAMVASFLGILFTTIISWKTKGAKCLIESNKNIFYSWLQTELLPVLSGNTLTAISLLQSNLTTFNQTFKGNIEKFDNALANVRKVSGDQAEALKAINQIDINKVARANVTVLKELQKSTSQLDKFNQYLLNVNGYLDAVTALNTNLDHHLNRTEAIERMGVFFEKEINQVQSREESLKEVVNSVDKTLKDSFNKMVDSMNMYLGELKSKTTSELETIRDAYEQYQRTFITKLQEQQDAISKKTTEMDNLLVGIQSLSETKEALSSLSNYTKDNCNRLELIVRALQSIKTGSPDSAKLDNGRSSGYSKAFNTINTIVNVVTLLLVIVAFVFIVLVFVG